MSKVVDLAFTSALVVALMLWGVAKVNGHLDRVEERRIKDAWPR